MADIAVLVGGYPAESVAITVGSGVATTFTLDSSNTDIDNYVQVGTVTADTSDTVSVELVQPVAPSDSNTELYVGGTPGGYIVYSGPVSMPAAGIMQPRICIGTSRVITLSGVTANPSDVAAAFVTVNPSPEVAAWIPSGVDLSQAASIMFTEINGTMSVVVFGRGSSSTGVAAPTRVAIIPA